MEPYNYLPGRLKKRRGQHINIFETTPFDHGFYLRLFLSFFGSLGPNLPSLHGVDWNKIITNCNHLVVIYFFLSMLCILSKYEASKLES